MDWSACAFGFILMQPDNSPESANALSHLLLTGECRFDLTLKGARLRPIRFGSRRCTPQEQHYHSFVSEEAVSCWAINQNHKYWLCDCSGVKEILEYDGLIHQVCQWAQELLGYCFHIVHRPARMMADVDAFTRRYEPLITSYLCSAVTMDDKCHAQRPAAYAPSMFTANPMKCPDHVPVLPAADSSTPDGPSSTAGTSVDAAGPSTSTTALDTPTNTVTKPDTKTVADTILTDTITDTITDTVTDTVTNTITNTVTHTITGIVAGIVTSAVTNIITDIVTNIVSGTITGDIITCLTSVAPHFLPLAPLPQ
jgi:hypothetical protein